MGTVIHLIRHGEVHNLANIRYGQIPGFGLSRRGQDQARAAGRYLRTLGHAISALVSSPLERAIQTATLMQDELAVGAFQTDDRLIEAPNRFDGRSRMAPLYPWNWPHMLDPFTPSWGEPFADVAKRMQAAIVDRSTQHVDGHVVLVSHQAPIWLARLALSGHRGPPWLSKVRCTHASITSLELAGDRFIGESYWEPG